MASAQSTLCRAHAVSSYTKSYHIIIKLYKMEKIIKEGNGQKDKKARDDHWLKKEFKKFAYG